MATYTYHIEVYADLSGPLQDRKLAEFAGEVEADRYSQACVKAWPFIHQACDQLRERTGYKTGIGDLHVERKGQCS